MTLPDLPRDPALPGRPSPDAVLAAARRLQDETYGTWMRMLYRATVGLIAVSGPGGSPAAALFGRPARQI